MICWMPLNFPKEVTIFKLAMLLFKSHRNLSKYAYEILRLLVHQICILSEKAANEEFYGLFVNTNGHFNGQIPADSRMEYLVKTIKTHLKHMHSNKTEKNIAKRTSAIATISDISSRYDSATNVLVRTKRHSDRSSRGDELIQFESIRVLEKCGHFDERLDGIVMPFQILGQAQRTEWIVGIITHG